MGCGVSSKPKPPPDRHSSHKRINPDTTTHCYERPLPAINGSILQRDRRLSLVSEGSEDELRSTEILQGNLSMVADDTNRTVRIYTGGSFSDTQHERSALIERVYPRLKTFCSEIGLTFQVVDVRWGVKDDHPDAPDDHKSTELAIKELKKCQKYSIGPNFVTFLSEKYGERHLPRTIPMDQYELLMAGVKDAEAKKLLSKWYLLDKSSVPNTYVLQPVSKNLPGYMDADPDVINKSRNDWWSERDVMQTALAKAAKSSLSDSAEAHKYIHSVSETEIRLGIIEAENPDGHCLWFHRNIIDFNSSEPAPDDLLSAYIDSGTTEHSIREKRQSLKHLKAVSLPKRIDRDNIINYYVPWTNSGIDPVNCRRHAEYIEQLCSDFEFHVKGQIKDALQERERSHPSDALSDEVTRHAIFCQSKIDMFYGRQNMIDQLEKYLVGTTRYPYVIHGASGSGKTSIMAIAAHKAWHLYSGKAIVITRFIGTSPDSSNIRTLLYSVVSQMRRLFQDDKPVPTDMKSLTDEFYTVLHLASVEQPIIVLLDSLDQFSPDYSARQLFWLPSKLPKHVRMLLSTLPEEQYECLPRLKMMLREDRHFLSIPRLNVNDVRSIVSRWLEKKRRSLQPPQVDTVVEAFSHCPLPLYLRICFDEACRWRSYDECDTNRLAHTVQEAVQCMFQRLEQSHGRVLVSRTLAYITLSRNGLSEGELEDILSCDDDVLNEVFMTSSYVPPVRRLPPLLLLRIQAELDQYLVWRGAESFTVLSWYHRQFREVAHHCYCSNSKTKRYIHTGLVDYYRGVWSDKPKPFTDPFTGSPGAALRHVAKQPLLFEKRYNLRKLMELPVHVVGAGMLTILKDELLCNLQWLTTKIEASSMRHILDDCNMARLAYPDDEDLKTISDVLQLSQNALQIDPHQLPGQLLGRIAQGNNKLMAQCCRPPYPALIPSEVILTPPGGQQISALSQHSDEVNSLDMSRDGSLAITCADDHTVKLWDVKACKLHKSIENVGDQPVYIRFCCGDTCAVVLDSKHLYLITLETSDMVVIDEPSLEISGDKVHRFLVFKNQSMLAVPVNTGISVLSLPSAKHAFTVTDHLLQDDAYGFGDILDGYNNYIAISSSGVNIQYEVHIVDLKKKKIKHAVKLFEKPKNEDEDELSVDALVMTNDESTVIASEMINNNLYLIGVEKGQILRMLEGNKKDFVDQFHITSDNRFLYFCNLDNLCVWNLESGERTYTLHHANRAQDILTRDQKNYVSISGDLVCMWDITRTSPQEEAKGKPSDYKITDQYLLPQTDRYIIVVKTSKASTVQIYIIYDVLQEKHIRTIKVDVAGEGNGVRCITEDEQLVIEQNRKVIVLNPRSHSYIVCQGQLSKYQPRIVPIKRKSWLICLSRGRRKLKLYNWQTGKVEALIQAQFRLLDFTTDPMGKMAAGMGDDDGPILIFDIERKAIVHKLFLREEIYSVQTLAISDDAHRLCVEVTRDPEDEDISTTINYLVVYDVHTGYLLHHLADWEALKVIENEHSGTDIDMTTYRLLHNGHLVLTCHYDHHVRFWDLNTGGKVDDVHLPEGHISGSGITLSPDGSRLILTTRQGNMTIWDTPTRQKLAAQTMDDPDSLQPNVAVGDASLLIINSEVKGKLTQLRLVGGGSKPRRDQRRLKETYSANAKLDGDVVELSIPEGEESDDPDTDQEELSADSDSERDEEDDEFLSSSSLTPALSQDMTALSLSTGIYLNRYYGDENDYAVYIDT